MSSIYTVNFAKVAITAEQDLFELIPADDKPLEVIGLFLGQSTDFGDAQAELLSYKVSRGWTTTGSGGTEPTPRPTDPNFAASGFTSKVNNTVVAKEGSEIVLHASAFNVMAGEMLWLPEGSAWKCSQGQTRLTGTVYVRES
jgi:hypothetical protein